MDHHQEYSKDDQHPNNYYDNIIGGSYRTVENDNSATDTMIATTITIATTSTTSVEQCENDSVNKPCFLSFTSMASSLPETSSLSSSKSSFSILNELPIEILREYILYPFCDGKTLSTLTYTLLLNCNNNKEQDDDVDTISTSSTNRNHHLVWYIIPKIIQDRFNHIANTIETNDNGMTTTNTTTSSSSSSQCCHYASDAIEWIRNLVVENDTEMTLLHQDMILLQGRQSLFYCDKEELKLSYLCRYMGIMSIGMIYIDYLECCLYRYSSHHGQGYVYPIYVGPISIQYSTPYESFMTICTTMNVVLTIPITKRLNHEDSYPLFPPGCIDIMMINQKQQQQQQQQQNYQTQTQHLLPTQLSIPITSTMMIQKFICEPNNTIPVGPTYGQLYGLSIDDENLLKPIYHHLNESNQIILSMKYRQPGCSIQPLLSTLFDIKMMTTKQAQQRRSNSSRMPILATDWILEHQYQHDNNNNDQQSKIDDHNNNDCCFICCWQHNNDEADVKNTSIAYPLDWEYMKYILLQLETPPSL